MARGNLNRRTFFKLAGATLAGAALPQPLTSLAHGKRPLPIEDTVPDGFVPLQRGRVLTSSVSIWDRIETPHELVKRVPRDGVILLGEEIEVPGTGNAYNHLWYRTRGGWVHSGWVQPMAFHGPPTIYTDVGRTGTFWIEVIEPSTVARKEPSFFASKSYDYIYGTVYLVTDVHTDETGTVWYNTYDEYADADLGISPTHHWVQAAHVQRIHESEFAAIRPWVMDKRIEVDRREQVMTCYEGDTVVLRTKVATGAAFTLAGGGVASFATPEGDHQVILKMPSRHMRAIEGERNTDSWFDLPGVPWNTFFTFEGIAIHGTFWHNDFGIVRSHGCVNVPIHIAKFIYRWTLPTAPYNDDFVRADISGMASTSINVA